MTSLHDASMAASQGGFQEAPSAAGGGFSGPGISPVTVRQAMAMRDDSYVILRGNITQRLGKDKYVFRDETGNIHVDIDQDKWGGKTVTPQDTVEIHGEVDKDWNSVEIDVDRIIMMK
ncbi:MAG: YgiW/YdeI family stress tolerance OB fold protein [Desulfovibrio sp.]|nr:YgiW/YdeI family stress tolerance OB fold protein [Desulfovibrio sp.]